MTTISEHKDCLDLSLAEVSLPRILGFLVRQLPERCRPLVVFHDIAWGDYILEAISFCNQSAFLAFASNNENGVVFFCHLSHRRVATNELTGRDLKFELLAQLYAALLLGLPAAVGKEDVWTAFR